VNGELIVTEDVPGAFAAAVVQAYQSRVGDSFSLALSGGELARTCYERLADMPEEPIDWWNVDVYWGDERCVPAEDPDSNQLLGRRALLERVGAANSVHPMICAEGPNAYQLKIGELGIFDLVHLGMGPDGHTASLFPDSPGLSAPPGQLVCLNSDPSGRNPHDRMTLTLEGLARARLILFTVSGPKKAEAMARLYRGEDLPAGRVSAEKIVWLVDPEASPV